MIHQYKNNGYNIVLDVNSGSVHVVDDVVYDVIPAVEEALCTSREGKELEETVLSALKDQYEEADIREALLEDYFIQRIFTKNILLTLRADRLLSRHSVSILPMTVTLPADIALQRKGSIMEEEH